MRSHHGPSTTTMAAITSSTPPSGRSMAKLSCAEVIVARPLISSTAATSMRTTVRRRPWPPVRPASGSARCRIVSCSSGVAFRQISTRPAALMISGQLSHSSKPMPNVLPTSSTTASTDARPAARVIPCRSDLAWLAMLLSAPSIGSSSQAST